MRFIRGPEQPWTLAAGSQCQSWRQARRSRRRIRLEPAKAILDRHLGRPALQADLTVRGGASADHLQALIDVARKRRAEPIDLDEREVLDIHAVPIRPEVVVCIW
jgi:hypothetical protein